MKKILFYNLFFLILFLFIFLEFLFPLFFKTPKIIYQYYEDRTVTFYPNKTLWSHTDEFRVKFKTNNYGFNDQNFNENTDILILGDSFVQSIEVSFKNHFAEYLRTNLDSKVAKIGMSGYGNSHYFSNYLKFANILNPKLVIIFNFGNDLGNNFCNNNTQDCSDLITLCDIQDKKTLEKEIKFLKIKNSNEYKFIYAEKKADRRFIKKIVNNYLDKFQSYYSIRYIYKLLLKNKQKIDNKTIKEKPTKCEFASENYFVREYYQNINSIIYNKIVKIDKRDLLFVNINNIENDRDLDFIKSTFKQNNYPHINLDDFFHEDKNLKNIETNFKIDKHWNEYGHSLVGKIIYEYLSDKKL